MYIYIREKCVIPLLSTLQQYIQLCRSSIYGSHRSLHFVTRLQREAGNDIVIFYNSLCWAVYIHIYVYIYAYLVFLNIFLGLAVTLFCELLYLSTK